VPDYGLYSTYEFPESHRKAVSAEKLPKRKAKSPFEAEKSAAEPATSAPPSMPGATPDAGTSKSSS
jgi:hypothetical protein